MKKSLLAFMVFILVACSTPPTPTPFQTPQDTLTPLPPSTESISPTQTEKALRPVDHVSVFLAEQDIVQTINGDQGSHGVYIHEIGSPDPGMYYMPSRQLHGASTIKMAIAVVALKVFEAENFDLFTYIPQGQSLTLSGLVENMVVNHDEYSTVFLIDYINGLGYRFDDVLTEMGFVGFKINLRLTTAESMGMLLEGLETDTLGLKNNQFLLDLLEVNSPKDNGRFPWAINGSLPGSYSNIVGAIYDADQTIPEVGTIKFVANEAGIWTTPTGHRFVIVILSNFQTERDFILGNSVIEKVSKILSESIAHK